MAKHKHLCLVVYCALLSAGGIVGFSPPQWLGALSLRNARQAGLPACKTLYAELPGRWRGEDVTIRAAKKRDGEREGGMRDFLADPRMLQAMQVFSTCAARSDSEREKKYLNNEMKDLSFL
jgi:hypothetical protein